VGNSAEVVFKQEIMAVEGSRLVDEDDEIALIDTTKR
jgi:hypothetical protein